VGTEFGYLGRDCSLSMAISAAAEDKRIRYGRLILCVTHVRLLQGRTVSNEFSSENSATDPRRPKAAVAAAKASLIQLLIAVRMKA
jgi:hypothetical protein